MALKDLIISKTEISEDLIENILKNNVQLIKENEEVYLLPPTKNLSGTTRVILYLCGKKAWSLILNKEITTSIVELSNNTGIKGNTLRPILKKLKDSKQVDSQNGKYYLLPMGLTFLQQNLNKDNGINLSIKTTKHKARRKNSTTKTNDNDIVKTRKTNSSSGIPEQILIMINEGFFDQPKSLSEIIKELDKRAFKIPLTSLPSYVIPLTKSRKLERNKEKRGEKSVWVYKKLESKL